MSKKQVVGYVSKELKEQFDEISKKLAINKSKFIENHIYDLVNKNKNLLRSNQNKKDK